MGQYMLDLTRIVPYFRMPFGPVYTSITLGLEGSIVMIRSALSATSAGLSRIWEHGGKRKYV